MIKYTELQVRQMTSIYEKNPTMETVIDLAVKLRKTKMSIISKLDAMGIYRKKIYLTKNGELPRKKVDLILDLESSLGCNPEELKGLSLSKKEALVCLYRHVEAMISEMQEEITSLTSELDK
jgi:hypothetical protein